ncbi:MAG TPA: FtsX-like permease family protein, partial [Gemmatimonadaceae bacterium]|nr:FtsX-like permease family protein [Gemmatimonadaceae bacterium]
EIGVRLALGATPSRIARTVLARGLALAALGTAAGVALAYGASGLLRTLLFETRPTDLATYAGVTALLLAIAAAASLAPAWRAARLDPVQTLRQE